MAIPNVKDILNKIKDKNPKPVSRVTPKDENPLAKLQEYLKPKGQFVKDFVKAVPGAQKSVLKKIGDTAVSMGQSSFRAYAGVSGPLYNKAAEVSEKIVGGKLPRMSETFTPEGQFQKDLYGTDQPISLRSVAGEVNERLGKSKYGPMAGFVLGVADAVPGGNLTKNAAVTVLKSIDDVSRATKTLSKVLGVSTEVAQKYAPDIAKLTDEVKIGAIIDKAIAESQDVAKFAQRRFEGLKDLSTKLIEKLKGRTTVSKQFIEDLTNAPDLKQPERDLIRKILGEGDTDPLLTEARKYKSAEEFVGKQKAIHHGTTKVFDEFDPELSPGGSAWFTDSRRALETGQDVGLNRAAGETVTIMDRYVKPGLKLVDRSTAEGKKLADDLMTGQLESMGYRGIIHEADPRRGRYVELFYPNEDALTKSQLTDIWKKAQGSKDIDVTDFANKVKTELLPLKTVETPKPPEDMGDFMEWKSSLNRYENIVLPDDVRGPVANYQERVYESPIKTSAGNVHFDNATENYFAHSRIEDLPDGATRRVIETQSDLFQKGRLESEGPKIDSLTRQEFEKGMTPEEVARYREAYRVNKEEYTVPLSSADANPNYKAKIMSSRKTIDELENKAYPIVTKARQAEIAKLEPYRNTWHERVIREEVKKAAQDGKTKLQFPTGETAMKIEGFGGTDSGFLIRNTNGEFDIQATPNTLNVGQEVTPGLLDDVGGVGQVDDQTWIITDVLGDGKFKAMPKEHFDSFAESKGVENLSGQDLISYAEQHGTENFWRSKESFDISGKVDTENPIYKFYEKEVGRYLKNKYRAELITDARGVKWWEVKVDPSLSKAPVEAFGFAAGIEEDESGGITFDARKAALGVVGSIFARRKTKTPEGIEEFIRQQSPSLWQKFKSMVAPARNLEKESKQVYYQWSSSKLLGKVKADDAVAQIDIPNVDGLDTMFKYEKGQVTPYTKTLKDTFDGLYQEASRRGFDVEFRENYLPHVYRNTTEEVRASALKYLKDLGVEPKLALNYVNGLAELPDAKRFGMNPFFTKTRLFPDYKTAMKYGLSPKYSNPAQLVGHYIENLENMTANRALMQQLQDRNLVVDAMSAPSHWVPVDLSFSNQGLYAEPKLAKVLNGVVSKATDELDFIQSTLRMTAETSRRMQEIMLSAGIPKTSVNFFAIGQVIKEITAGNFKVFSPFIRSNFVKRSAEHFNQNREYLRMMAGQGLDMRTHYGSYESAYKNLAGNRRLTEALGEGFDGLFNEKTFASFMPQLHLQVFKDAFAKGMKRGMKTEEAQQFAGDVVKASQGLVEDLGRSKQAQDAISSVFFAPQFREGIVRVLTNTAKSVTSEIRNPAFYRNRRLVMGAALTYAMYNMMNYKLNGNFMWDNENGREFAIKIPRENGEIVYFEFMPSFLAFPRNMVQGGMAIARGDTEVTGQKFGSLMSVPLKILSEVLSNQDYFGNPIYDTTDPLMERVKKVAIYTGLQVNHPYIREVVEPYLREQLTERDVERKPIWQSVVIALELPLKFSTQEKVNKSLYYEALEEIQKERAALKDSVKPKYTEIQALLAEGNEPEARALLETLSKDEYAAYRDLADSDKRSESNKVKANVYPVYLQIQELLKDGKEDRARDLLESLSKEEYVAYESIKASLE